jgi:hypothetical protein
LNLSILVVGQAYPISHRFIHPLHSTTSSKWPPSSDSL